MSIKHLNWAFEQDLQPGPKLTLIALCDSLNADGEWHIKHDTLAKKTSQHRSTVIRHMAQLVERGLVEATPTRHADGRRGYNLYKVAICDMDDKPESHPATPESHHATTRVAPCDSNNHPYSPNTHPDNTVSEKPPVSDLEKAFENWNIIASAYTLPLATKLTPARKQRLKARLSEVGLSGWNEALENLERAPWMHGDNDRGWRADFDFMLQPSSLMKLLEGAYLKNDEQTH